ncbi:hypothetical protein B0H17DRAFT_1078284 [Mycena rosella]|uniref:F-box domain-containing protein n=1 Tax=Mycena rosella TaxID=1033263 RepID=A0AAD7D4S3_MYCRO|nr:hypothetical protein B0H17DRAFT_1078284 [Mycena rosella]
MEFLELPLELLSDILSHLAKPQHIAAACRVNKSFYEFGTPRLYERASIYSWHKRAKTTVVSLFNTLAHYPHLAKYILKLEIRDFPKSMATDDLDALVLSGLKNCVNLKSCTWTRDGALNSAILSVLQASNTLAELEINGHSDGHYDARILADFSHLRNLTLICKMSPLVTDNVLEALAPGLMHLEQFSITGCPRVSHLGIWAVVSQNSTGLRALGLEGLSQRFNLAALAALCAEGPALASLTSLTLSVHTEAWLTSVSVLLAGAPLEVFQIYATSAFVQTTAMEAFWRNLVTAHGPRLTRFSVHRMLVSLPTIEDVCMRCPALTQLFVVVDPGALGPLAGCLSRARRLATVHVNFQYRPTDDWLAGEAPSVLKAPEALAIVRRCPETIALFGCNARVWQVERQIRRNEDGELVAERFLAKYDSPDIPEQFLVVRT